MNHQKFNSLLFFAAGFLIIAQPTAGAQEPVTRVAATASTDAADRQFLNNLEQADAAKAPSPQPIPSSTTAATPKAQAAKKEPQPKAIVAVTKAPEPTIRRATRMEAPKTPAATVGKTEPVVTVTTTTTTLAAVPVEDRRPDDNGFFHRLFRHRNREIQ